MEKRKNDDRLKKSLKTLGRAFESYENTIKTAVTILAIVAALFIFGKNGENDTILTTEANDGSDRITASEENQVDSSDENQAIINEPLKIMEQKYITVDISGEVNKPGVYRIKEEDRLNDLIIMAGGLTEEADIDRINRARFLSDGAKVYIPSINEKSLDLPLDHNSGDETGNDYLKEDSSSKGKVNINTASQKDLETIPSIGPITAEKIIRYRETISKFQSIEDIMNVPGIGEKTFENIKDYISI